MSDDATVVGFQLLINSEVTLHSQQELEQLAKKKVIPSKLITYNQQVIHL